MGKGACIKKKLKKKRLRNTDLTNYLPYFTDCEIEAQRGKVIFPQSSFVSAIDLESGCPGSQLGRPQHSMPPACPTVISASSLHLCGVSRSLLSLLLLSFILINTPVGNMGQVSFSHFTVRKMKSREIKEWIAQRGKKKDLGMNTDLRVFESWYLEVGASPSACAPGAGPGPGSGTAGGKVLEPCGLQSSEPRSLTCQLGDPGKTTSLSFHFLHSKRGDHKRSVNFMAKSRCPVNRRYHQGLEVGFGSS